MTRCNTGFQGLAMMNRIVAPLRCAGLTLGLMLTSSVVALAQEAAPAADAAATPPLHLDSGHTAWVMVSAAFVLMMTIPGLALFYAGMVRKKNILDTMLQSFVITCLVTLVWFVIGYSLAFHGDSPYFGDLSALFLQNLIGPDQTATIGGILWAPGADANGGAIPESVNMMFQMTFAIITPALITGAFADRMKFSAVILFTVLWSLVVYSSVAHWVWAPSGFLAKMGVLDYAGGTVVHINAGVAGLVGCLLVGKRRGYGTDNFAPHNLAYTLIGASLLWVGWFGFNAGSALTADGRAAMAIVTTQVATAAAALTWMFVEWAIKGKPSALGLASGAVAGLVAITPASGFVGPEGSVAIGVAAGLLCFFGATSLKNALGYDDSLDAFGVHAVGGIVGALLTGVFAVKEIGGTSGLLQGNPAQLLIQAEGVGIVIVFDVVVSLVLYKIVDLLIGLRVSQEEEIEGLDISLHGETVH
jgi:Amt family ammonium transporter